MIKKICLICEKEFTTYPCLIKIGKGKFCSKRCANSSHPKNYQEFIICKQCGKVFKNKRKRLNPTPKYCSINCSSISQDKKIIKKCPVCNKEFKTRISKTRLNRGKYCSKKCFNKVRYRWGKGHPSYTKHLIGKNHPNWRGGKSFEPYSIDWTETLKKSIRERDKYTCQLCDKNPAIQVHHIDYDKKNCNLLNLITLCKSCHTKTNHNRKYWIKYFQTNLNNL